MKLKVIFLALICLLLVSVFGVLFFKASQSNKSISGVVVNYADSTPISIAKVSITQNGAGFIGGRFVWGEYYNFDTITDSKGTFSAHGLANDSVIIDVTADGFVHHVGWYPVGQVADIKLKRLNPNYSPLPSGSLEIGFEDGKAFGWIFSERRKTFDPNEADIFPKSRGPNIVLENEEGISIIQKDKVGVEYDMLIYTDTAPEDGYSSMSALDFNSRGGVYFVKTRDGKYAKFSFDPTNYAVTGSNSDLGGDTWTLLLDYVFNPDGSLNLEYQR